MNEILYLLFMSIFIIFLKNLLQNYIKIRRKYRRLWVIDYIMIFLKALNSTGKDLLTLSKKLYAIIQKTYSYFKFRNIQYSKQEIITKIRSMNPREFEIFCANLYKELGYKVKLTEATCDGGKDLIIWDKKSNKYYVECKHYSEYNYVGREIIQKLEGACFIDGVPNAILITTGNIHNNALKCKEKVDNLTLIDMDGILDMITKIQPKKVPFVLNAL